jgi:hypothetical protein
MSGGAVREAVASGEYRKAALLFDAYARSLPANEASLHELADLLRWTKSTVLCARAHLESQAQAARDTLNVVAAYSR